MSIIAKQINDENGKRKSTWLVCYYADRQRVRRYFKTRVEAEQYAYKLRKGLQGGAYPTHIAEALRRLSGTGHRLVDVVNAGLALLASKTKTNASPSHE